MLVKFRFLITFLTFFLTLNLVNASTNLSKIKESIEPYCNGENPSNFLTHKSIKKLKLKLIIRKNGMRTYLKF